LDWVRHVDVAKIYKQTVKASSRSFWHKMRNFLHWGDQLNWMPVICLGVASALVFLTRMLTSWIFVRRLVVPTIVSSLYFLSGVALILVALWGLIRTAWWMLPLGILAWFIIHIPFRDTMEAWSTFQNTSMALEDAELLVKGELTAAQERAIRKRLRLDK
jgi:hypothetical protein